MDVVIDKSDVQLVERVRVKRNRGLKADILKLLVVNPNDINKDITPLEVFEALKSNVYGGSKPVSLNTVMSTMSQLKKRQEVGRCGCGHDIDDHVFEDNSMDSVEIGCVLCSCKQFEKKDVVKSEPKEQ